MMQHSQMSDAQALQVALDHDWTEVSLQEVEAAIAVFQKSESARAALREYDELRTLLQSPSGEGMGDGPPLESPGNARSVVQTSTSRRHHHTDSSRPVAFLGRLRLAMAASIILMAGVVVGHLASTALWPSDPATDTPGETAAAIDDTVGHPGTASASAVGYDDILTAPSPGERSQRAAVFTKVSAALDDQASWMVLSDRGDDVGLRRSSAPVNNLTILRMSVTSPDSQTSMADVVLAPGASAKVSLMLAGGITLQCRFAKPFENGTIAAWFELREGSDGLDEGPIIAATACEIATSEDASTISISLPNHPRLGEPRYWVIQLVGRHTARSLGDRL